MVMTNQNCNENWPYHLYEGSKPELKGSYVPCDTNPCHVHGGSEIYAASPEEAYAKAHANDNWGFTDVVGTSAAAVSSVNEVVDCNANMSTVNQDTASGQVDDGSIDLKQSNSNEKSSQHDNALATAIKNMQKAKTKNGIESNAKKAADIIASKYGYGSADEANAKLMVGDAVESAYEQEMNSLFNKMVDAKNAINEAAMAKKKAMVQARAEKKAAASDKAHKRFDSIPTSNEAHERFTSLHVAMEAYKQGLYVADSPLVHYHQNDSDEMDVTKLAHEIFPGAVCAHEVQQDLHDRTNSVLAEISDDEEMTIRKFTGMSSSSVNQTLRHGFSKYDSEEYKRQTNELIANMDSVMQRPETAKVIDKDMVVFRRRFLNESEDDRGGEEKKFYKAVSKSMENGSEPIVKRLDFMSTTWKVPKHFSCAETGFIIKIPKGTRAIDVSGISNHPYENELLIDKGYRFKVVGIYENSKLSEIISDGKKIETVWSDQHPIIALELIPPRKKLASKKAASTQSAS